MHQNNPVHPFHGKKKKTTNTRGTQKFQWQPGFPPGQQAINYRFQIQGVLTTFRKNGVTAHPLQNRSGHFVIHTLWPSQLLTKQWKELSLLQAPMTTWVKDVKMKRWWYETPLWWTTRFFIYIYVCVRTHKYILPPATRGQLFYSPYNSKYLIRLISIYNLYTPWASLLSFLSSDNFQAASFVQPKKFLIKERAENWICSHKSKYHPPPAASHTPRFSNVTQWIKTNWWENHTKRVPFETNAASVGPRRVSPYQSTQWISSRLWRKEKADQACAFTLVSGNFIALPLNSIYNHELNIAYLHSSLSRSTKRTKKPSTHTHTQKTIKMFFKCQEKDFFPLN